MALPPVTARARLRALTSALVVAAAVVATAVAAPEPAGARPATAGAARLRLLAAAPAQAWTQSTPYPSYPALGHYPAFPMSSPAVGDVTGDGRPDVVVGGMDGVLRVRNAATGALEAQVTLEGPIQASPVLVDLYGRGRPQALVASASTVPGNTSSVRVIAFSGSTATTLFSRSTTHQVGSAPVLQRPFLATPAVGDIDGDGQPEIVAANLDQHLYAWNLDGSQVFPPRFLYDTLLSSPVLVDWNFDGRDEIVLGADMGPYPGSPFPAARGMLWSFDGGGNVSPGYPVQIPDQVVWAAPTATDLNGDGRWDVLLGTGMNYPEPGGTRLYAYDLATRNPLGGFPVAVAGRTYSTPVVADLVGGRTVLIGTGRGWLYSVDRAGRVRWRQCTTRFSPCTENGGAGPDFLQVSPAVADVDGDGAQEVIVSTEKDLKVYDLATGAGENISIGGDGSRNAPVTVAQAWPNAATPSVASVGGKATIFLNGIADQGDGHIGAGDVGFVQAWQTGQALGAAAWPTDKGGFSRTGAFGTVPDPRPGLRSFVAATFQDFLGRAATGPEKDLVTAQILGGGTTKAGYLRQMVTSDQWLGAVVTRFYRDTLGRDPDAGGLAYWVGILRTGRLSVAEVAAQFYASAEYYAGRGGGSDATWVGNLYQVLLGRPPDGGGLAYWTGLIRSAGRPAVAFSFYQSNESSRARVRNLYLTLLGREPDPGGLGYWARILPAQGDLALALNLALSAEYAARAVTRFPRA